MIHTSSSRVFGGVLVLILAALTGCSSSGDGVTKAKYCPENYDPLKTTSKSFARKIDMKPGQTAEIAKGDYSYQGSQIYVNDKASGLRVHLVQSRDYAGRYKTGVICGGGIWKAKVNEKPFEFEAPFVSDVRVDENGNIQIRRKIYKFSIDTNPKTRKGVALQQTVVSEGDWEAGNPADTYPDYAEAAQYFMSMKGQSKDFKILSHLKKSVPDEKTGKEATQVVRLIVALKTVTADEREEVDKKMKESDL